MFYQCSYSSVLLSECNEISYNVSIYEGGPISTIMDTYIKMMIKEWDRSMHFWNLFVFPLYRLYMQSVSMSFYFNIKLVVQ